MLAAAVAKGRRCWFLVHRRELVDQSVRTLVESADLHTGIVAAGYPADAAAPVQVCSVGSLARRMGQLRPPDLVIIDECHHACSASWAALLGQLSGAVHVGLTATPARLDGRGLRPHFDAMLLGPTTADLMAAGYLSPYRLFAPSIVDTSQVHTVAGDYNKAEVSALMAASTVVGDAVSTYRRHAAGRRALVFAWSLEASRGLAGAFAAAGVPAAHVDGETPPGERRAAMAAFRAGDLRVITSVDLFGEGLDVPAVDAIFMLRPTSSLGLYLQQVGRGLRPAPGKDACLIFDHCGNYTRHGLPDDPREWSLDGRKKGKAKPKPAPLKRCPQCFAVASIGARACPACGAPYLVQSREVEQVEGELVAIDPAAVRAQTFKDARAARSLAELQAIGKRAGYAHGWAWHRWMMSPHNHALLARK